MSVYRRDLSSGPAWFVDIQVGGTRVNERLPGVRTKAQALAAQERLRAEYQSRSARGGALTRMTVQTAIGRYVAERLAPKTGGKHLDTYLSYLGMIRDAFGPDTPIETITDTHLSEWWGQLIDQVQPNTAKRYLGQCKSLLAFARAAGAGGEVPTIAPTIASDARVRWLTDEEEARLLAACPPWLADLVTLYMDTGARKSELRGLTWRHVKLLAGQRGSISLIYTKGQKPRGVPLTARAKAVLERLRSERAEVKPDDRVCLHPDNKAAWVPVGDFKKSWASALSRAKIDDFHVHDLRHHFASKLVMRGVPLLNVSRLMGHKTTRMTERYAHLAPAAYDSAIAALDAAF